MANYALTIDSSSLSTLLGLIAKRKELQIPHGQRVSYGTSLIIKLKAETTNEVATSFNKILAEIVSGSGVFSSVNIINQDKKLADNIIVNFEGPEGLLGKIVPLLKFSPDCKITPLRNTKTGDITIKVELTTQLPKNIIPFNERLPVDENIFKQHLAIIAKALKIPEKVSAPPIIKPAPRPVFAPVPIRPVQSKPVAAPAKPAAEETEEQQKALELELGHTYLFKETGKPEKSLRIFAHAVERFGGGICYFNENEGTLKRDIKELAGKKIDYYWFTRDTSQDKDSNPGIGKYDVSIGKLGIGEERGIYPTLLKKIRELKRLAILIQLDELLTATRIQNEPSEIKNFVRHFSKEIKEKPVVLILVMTAVAGVHDATTELLGAVSKQIASDYIWEL